MKTLQLKTYDIKNKSYKNTGMLQIKNSTENKAELLIYGDIVNSAWDKWEDTDMAPVDVREFLDDVKGKDLDIFVNSPGGSVTAGMGMYNMLKRHEGTKNVYVDGLAGSIASVIAMAGDNIYIPKNSYLMIHRAWNCTYGNSEDFRSMADRLDVIDQGILNVYSEKLKDGVDINKIKEMVNAETWLTGDQAEKYFNINVIEDSNVSACISDLFTYKNMPSNLVKKENSKDNEELDLLRAKLLLELE